MEYKFHCFTLDNATVYLATFEQTSLAQIPYQQYLSDEELKMLAIRKKINRKLEFIYSRYLIKKTANISADNFKLYTVKYCEKTQQSGIFQNDTLISALSLSHCSNYIAFAFSTKGQPIGLDIEKVSKRSYQKISQEFFPMSDVKAIQASEDFFRIWTEKEAVAKLTRQSIWQLLSISSEDLHQQFKVQHILDEQYVVSIATQ